MGTLVPTPVETPKWRAATPNEMIPTSNGPPMTRLAGSNNVEWNLDLLGGFHLGGFHLELLSWGLTQSVGTDRLLPGDVSHAIPTNLILHLRGVVRVLRWDPHQ